MNEVSTVKRLLEDPQLRRLLDARHHDPFSLLGRHPAGDGQDWVRVYLPGARQARLPDIDEALDPVDDTGLFVWRGRSGRLPVHYQLAWSDPDGADHSAIDPYTFEPQLPQTAIDDFNAGRHHRAWELLGARPAVVDDIAGTLFSTWAPNAERVSVVGDFNGWDGRRHPMRARGHSGVWELYIPGIGAGAIYKYEIRNAAWGSLHLKTDPYARAFELRPANASRVIADSRYAWGDHHWMRERRQWLHAPISVYEVHLASWRRHSDGAFWRYEEIADELIPYVTDMGFTHVELMPVMEHPLDASWGYQCTGYFAPTQRFGDPDGLRYLIDRCHQAGIGVYLDWVPSHFPKDDFALARFDGSALYEHEDTRLAEHKEWGTLAFNYARHEVRSFLISNALYWLEVFHADGLRVDAVASMLYLDYSRNAGEWLPNRYGGNENLEAVSLLKEMNTVTHREAPGTVIIAEESTAWPQVTRPTYLGGLGFSMKWNMGWMHDTLTYISKDPIHRHYHHNELTFGLMYAFTENFVLPFSHDEVVHGKGSLYGKMPGDDWQKRANLRLLFTYMLTYPGKKLLFMGQELANPWEWNHELAIPWHLLDDEGHRGVQHALKDLNRLYRELPALHEHDFEPSGFEWIDCHDAAQSVLSYLRRTDAGVAAVILNFTPVPRHDYRIGLPQGGRWIEVFNSDAGCYGGGDIGNGGHIEAEASAWMNRPWSAPLTLPPLGGLILTPSEN